MAPGRGALFGEALDAFADDPGGDPAAAARSAPAAAQGWFLSHVGEAVIGAEQAGEAVEVLQGARDREAVSLAIQCHCASLT